jgi:hypothetical protein
MHFVLRRQSSVSEMISCDCFEGGVACEKGVRLLQMTSSHSVGQDSPLHCLTLPGATRNINIYAIDENASS